MLPASRRAPWLPLLLLLLSLGAISYCLSGYAMAASFSVAHPERHAYWERVALAYLAAVGASLIGFVASGVVLWRRLLVQAPPSASKPSHSHDA